MSFQLATFTHLRRQRQIGFRHCGLTMIELLVAMVISLLIALAAIAALTVSRQGFTSVDAASQLRDNGRFAAELIQRLGVQSGFKDVQYASTSAAANDDFPPSVTGFNNAISSATDPLNAATTRTSADGSDVLILRSQLVKLNANSPDADGSMIDCMGNTVTTNAAPSARDERMASILSVADSNGEPSLMCATVNSAGTITDKQPIIQGVESFQVLYGTQGVTAGAIPTATYGLTAGAPAPTTSAAWSTWMSTTIDQVPDKYLRADQMTTSTTVGTNANWRRVRSIRIGMILRGAPGSAQNVGTQYLYPFGTAKSSSTGAAGSAFSDATNDKGTVFVAPADGRLRQVVTFTVHLRNSQTL